MNSGMQNIAIFGATSAIAIASARELIGQETSFFLVARNRDRLSSVRNDLLARGAKTVDTFVTDLGEESSHATIVAEMVDKLKRIDIVLIAHGALGDHDRAVTDWNTAREVLEINLLSPLSLLTRIVPILESQGSGTIVVISSVAGERGRKSNYVYGCAKAGLSTFLSGLRNRLAGKGVCVITVKPGFVDTPMTKKFKKGILWATADQVARGIGRAIKRRSDIVYLPWFWWPIMTIIKLIPERVFKRLNI